MATTTMESPSAAKVEQAPETLLIRGQEVPVATKWINQSQLKFFADNPRVYSLVRGNGKEPTQDEIQRQLLEMEHVRELIQDIKRNGGLIDPLIVKDGTFDVLEGNSRLAAYRFLAKSDAVKWGRVKCTVLPHDIDESLVFSLLGQYHVKGKKDWLPYEQAGFLYRRFKKHDVDAKTLALEIGLSQKKVKHLIDTYQFMIDHDEVDRTRWSFYDEYLKSSKIKKAREQYSNFDEIVVEKIDSGEIERAVDVRDRLPVICSGPAKTLQRFAKGDLTFEDAYDRAEAAGGSNATYKRVASFRQWLAEADTGDAILESAGQVRAKFQYEVEKLYARVQSLRAKLKDG